MKEGGEVGRTAMEVKIVFSHLICDGNRSEIFEPGQVGKIFLSDGSDQVGSSFFGLGLGLEKFP